MSVPGAASSSGTPVEPNGDTRTRTFDCDEPVTTDVRAPAARPLPTVPGFRVVRWLGGGGMGDVYEAVEEKHGVTFALKMIRPDRVNPAFTARFHQEIRALMTLDHPHVVRIFKDDDAGGRPYFTMRFVRGGNLADKLVELRADPERAVRLLVRVIDAVEYLHQQGQVHRDLKPTNILLDEAGEPILSDFGLVKDLHDLLGPDELVPVSPAGADSTAPGDETRTGMPTDGRPHTQVGAKLGTYAYMSPEQFRGDVHRVGPASDIYALGVILYELLTGRRPERDIPAPPPGIDPTLDRIVARCLSPDPAERYPSAARLAADLRAWVEPPALLAPQPKWPLVGLAAAILILVVGITLAMLRPAKDAELNRWRASARQQLKAGESVTLVDGDGNPAPGLRVVAGDAATFERDANGWLVVRAPGPALFEFLDDPWIDGFVLAGEFRQPVGAGFPEAGLYAGRRTVPARGSGDWQYRIEFIYREHPLNAAPPGAVRPPGPPPAPPPVPPGGKKKGYAPVSKKLLGPPTTNRLVRFHGSRFDGLGDTTDGGRSWDIGPDRPEVGGPWRKLAIHARGDAFRVGWEAEREYPVTNLRPDQLAKMQNRGGVAWPDPPLDFTARGGLGVTVAGGSAAVRNLTITPSR